MFTPIHITTRHLLRQYKDVIEQVKKTKAPAVVVSQQQPQVAIVSLDDLERLTLIHTRRSGQALLETAWHMRDLLAEEHLPEDLSTHHDHYLWGTAPTRHSTTDATDAAANEPEEERYPKWQSDILTM